MTRFSNTSHAPKRRVQVTRSNNNRAVSPLALTKIVFKTDDSREKVSFLRSFYREYTRLREMFPAFLFTPRTYYTMGNLSRDIPLNSVFDIVPYFLGTASVPDIKTIEVRKTEVVFMVRGPFEANWFHTLANVMKQMTNSNRYTLIHIVYAQDKKTTGPLSARP